MTRVHFYNPGYEASISLSSQAGRSYTPPKNVALLRRDLATLPVYWIGENETVLVPETQYEEYFSPSFTTRLAPSDELEAWGRALELTRFGEIPYTEAQMRFWSDRLRSVELFEAIIKVDAGHLFPRGIVHPKVIKPGDSLPNYPFVLKRRFGSSGRGIAFFQNGSNPDKTNSTKEPVITEPFYDKIEDLGFEFHVSEKREVSFLGISLFDTITGRYTGNRLNDPHRGEIEDTFQEYISLLTKTLEKFDLCGYTGPLGIDTLTYLSEGETRIVPLIEVNIRRTMGHLALALESRYPEASRFEILFGDFGTLAETSPLYLRRKNTAPLSPGRYPLTPILPDTRFCAVLTV